MKNILRFLAFVLLALFPTYNAFALSYCDPTGTTSSYGGHYYGIASCNISVNGVSALSFTVDADVCNWYDTKSFELNASDVLNFDFTFVDTSKAPWEALAIFIDWNQDGEFDNSDTSTEKYVVMDNPGTSYPTSYEISVPDDFAWIDGNSELGFRFVSGEAYTHKKIADIAPCTRLVYGSIVTVKGVEPVSIGERTITFSVQPAGTGTLSNYSETSTFAISCVATANPGYKFVNWTVGGVEVSTSPSLVDETEGDKEYVANFELDPTLDRSAWTATASSYEEDGEGAGGGWPKHTIDGNTGTFWHSDYSVTPNPTVPHWLQYNLGSVQKFTSFNYVSRNEASENITCNGNVKTYKLYVSNSDISANLGAGYVPNDLTAISEGDFVYDGTSAEHIVDLGAEYEGQYVFLLITDSWNSHASIKFGNCSEFYLYYEPIAVAPTRVITVEANPAEGGTVTGGGESDGAIVISATANEGYRFVNWTCNGEEISSSTYTDNSEGDKTYTANFVKVYNVTATAENGNVTISGQNAEGTFDENTTATLTATPNGAYIFKNWTLNDEVVGNATTLEITVTADAQYVANFEKTYFTDFGTSTRTLSDRYLNSITLNEQKIEVNQPSTTGAQIYFDKTSNVITLTKGADITPVIDWSGWKMHGYLYVDFDGDKTFTPNLGTNGIPAEDSELIAYTYYNGYDHTGTSTTTDADPKPGTMKVFTIPESVEDGEYVARYTVMWDKIDADATSDKGNGMCVVDFIIKVVSPIVPTYNVTAVANDATMGSVTSAITEQDVYTMEATANEGYEFVNWTVAGSEVSATAAFTYTATADAEVVANFQIIAEWPATVEALATAEGLIAQTGVGFPTTTSASYTALQSAIEAAQVAPTIVQKAALETAISAYYAETDVAMPEEGKAYAMVVAVTPSQQFYIYNNSDVLALADYTGSDFADEAKFLCTIVDGKYVFQNVTNNKYFAYPTKTSVDWMTGVSNSGLEAELQDISKFEIIKLVAGANTNVTATAEQLLGMVYMYGLRGYKEGVEEKGAIVVKNDKTFDGAGVPFCNGTYTSAIRVVEVDYTPVYSVSAEALPAEGGQVVISANEVEEGQTVELTATANEGYEFVNWTVAGEEVSTENPYTATITAETAFVANFQVKEYNVIYKVDGEVYTTETYDFGATVTAIAEPEKEGYTFSGWSEVPATMPASDVEVTGTFTVNSYTITYKVDGEEYATETYDFGAVVTPIAAPVKVGYTFSGWSEVPATMPASDVEVTGTFIVTPNLDVTAENKEETTDATYSTVTVGNEKVWDVKANTISADKLSVSVDADGVASEVKIANGGQITTVLEVTRTIEKGKWALMSLPFAVDLANVTVDGAAAVNNSNIKVMVYDAAYRAANSIELFTKSGWKELTGTTIAANQGFAVAINANNGDEQKVTFTAPSQIYDGSDKQISLSRYASTVNEGADADWNFYGNPTLAKAQKGTGYALYVYNAEDDSYDEYASSDVATYQPYAAWFVQSADDFNAMSFSAGVAGALAEADGVFGELQFTLNDDDEARIVLVEESSEEYVRNEDALYFPAINTNLSQLYLVKGNIKMAVSEQPSLTSMAMGYKAVKSGEQTLTLTSVPENTSVVLVDNVAGTETAMTLGDTYTFQSEAGTFNNRFVIETTDLTGISQAVADGEVKVLVNGTEIKVYGAEAGTEVVAYTTNGTVVASAVAVDGVTTLSTTATGVIVVKVANTSVKVIK